MVLVRRARLARAHSVVVSETRIQEGLEATLVPPAAYLVGDSKARRQALEEALEPTTRPKPSHPCSVTRPEVSEQLPLKARAQACSVHRTTTLVEAGSLVRRTMPISHQVVFSAIPALLEVVCLARTT